ncbi:MAG: hypothetical protein V4531_13765 [Actinomycetota bacterium]
MTKPRAASPLARAHRSLWILIGIAILAAGGVSAAVTAPPSPLVGLGFGLSALVLAVSFLLAGRVTIALERARRLSRPAARQEANPYPVLSKLFRVSTGASSTKK